MFFMYILRSDKTGRLYTGHTSDLGRRLAEHNSGMTTSTRHGAPWPANFLSFLTVPNFVSTQPRNGSQHRVFGWMNVAARNRNRTVSRDASERPSITARFAQARPGFTEIDGLYFGLCRAEGQRR
jgi:GIY-YIG catalytic domain